MPNNELKNSFIKNPEKYDLFVSKEDYQDNLINTINRIIDLKDKEIIEFGAGTGKLSIKLFQFSKELFAFDILPTMLDIAIEGWSFLATIGSSEKGWEPDNINNIITLDINNMIKATKENGSLIIIESLSDPDVDLGTIADGQESKSGLDINLTGDKELSF